jgi:hypothetical protein
LDIRHQKVEMLQAGKVKDRVISTFIKQEQYYDTSLVKKGMNK